MSNSTKIKPMKDSDDVSAGVWIAAIVVFLALYAIFIMETVC